MLKNLADINLGKWAVRMSIPLAVMYALYVVFGTIADSSAWGTDPDDPDQLKKDRSLKRGTFISTLLGGSAAIQAGLDAMKVPENIVLTNYGFIFASVIGFLGDKLVGTDEGLRESGLKWLKYGMGSLATSAFVRYLITALLDMFISAPIQGIIGTEISGFIESFKPMVGTTASTFLQKYDQFLGNNFMNILQSFVAIITFLAYTNDTRFLWAYPDKTLSKEERIKSITIKLAVSISAVMFLLAYHPSSEKYSGSLGGSYSTKLMYVIGAIILLTVGSMGMFSLDAPHEASEKEEFEGNENQNQNQNQNGNGANKNGAVENGASKIKSKGLLGLVLFGVLMIYGIVYPASKGNSVKGKAIYYAATTGFMILFGAAVAFAEPNAMESIGSVLTVIVYAIVSGFMMYKGKFGDGKIDSLLGGMIGMMPFVTKPDF